MTREEVMAKAIGDEFREQLAKFQPGAHRIEFPAPHVKVENLVETPEVTNNITVPPSEVRVDVDMRPVADAVKRVYETFSSKEDSWAAMCAAMAKTFSDLTDKLIEAMARPQPAPSVTIESPATEASPRPKSVRLETGHDGVKRAIPEY